MHHIAFVRCREGWETWSRTRRQTFIRLNLASAKQ